MKEMIILLAIMILILYKFFLGKFKISHIHIEILSFTFFLICLIHLLVIRVEGTTITAIFTSFRTLLLPMVLVLVGKWLRLDKKEIKALVNVIISISIASVIFGLIEIVIPVEKFWNGICNLYGYLRDIKGLPSHHFVNYVPGNFWGHTIPRRMASFFGSPLTMSYYLILSILLVFQLKKNKFGILNLHLLVIFVGLLLTETRMAIIAVILGILLSSLDIRRSFLFFKINKRFLLYLSSFIFIFSILFIFYGKVRDFFIKTFTVEEGRAIGHLTALESGIKNVIDNIEEFVLLGKGIGKAGAWSGLGGATVKSLASENAYLPIIAQIGGIGLLVFLLWWCTVYYSLRSKGLRIEGDDAYFNRIIKGLLVANVVYFLTGIVSEQILAFTSVAHFWILTGAVLGMRNKE